ncbi:MAG: hypothetical protein JOZ46_10365 [Candidatus Dormibacteraeota bacterium]|nr:hypothetical protein [Candidatus Dormibacteraeota bacterium]MBV9526202.1 hypothetical protein [Candidatus Dormibacteraeota bacterium]
MALASASLVALFATACSQPSRVVHTPPPAGRSAPSADPCADGRGKPCLEQSLPTPAPEAFPPVAALSSVAFSDRVHGWAAGYDCGQTCILEFAATDDGGSTWGMVTAVGTTGAYVNNTAPPQVDVRFVGRDGWIFGPGIFTTHDGGTTWRQTSSDQILALEPAAATVWAIACDYSDPCTPHLLVSAQAGDDWRPAAAQPPLAPHWSNSSVYAQAVLERSAGGTAFLAEHALADQQQLFRSRDQGGTWTSLTPPCSSIHSIRSADSVHVWVLCSEPCCTGNYIKGVFTSNDGGVSWTERAFSGSTTAGSIDFYGPAGSLTITSAGTGLYGGDGDAGVWRSVDGGTTWKPVLTGYCFGGGYDVSELWFANADDGWAVSTSSYSDPECPSLFRTVDGGTTWTTLAAPLGPTRG